jgi:Flp pilus assembly pilin Flp
MLWRLLVLQARPVSAVQRWCCQLQAAQGTVEYALVVALVVLACAVSLGVLGTHMSGVFSDVGNTLVGSGRH